MIGILVNFISSFSPLTILNYGVFVSLFDGGLLLDSSKITQVFIPRLTVGNQENLIMTLIKFFFWIISNINKISLSYGSFRQVYPALVKCKAMCVKRQEKQHMWTNVCQFQKSYNYLKYIKSCSSDLLGQVVVQELKFIQFSFLKTM